MEHLVDEYERNETRGSYREVTLRPGDDVKIMMLLERTLSPREIKNVENIIRMGRVRYEMAVAFGVAYRRHYPEALRRAKLEFERSDYRYSHEFFAHKFGKVPRSVPYHKRPHGQLVVTRDRIFLEPRKK
jgi:hypothetical protein